MLYTTSEIAEMYGGANNNVTPYMITHTWIPSGLKHIRGKKNSYLFKKEWVEQFLENCIESKNNTSKINIKKRKKNFNNKVYIVS